MRMMTMLAVFLFCYPVFAQAKPAGELETVRLEAAEARQAAGADPTIKDAKSPPVRVYLTEQKRRRLISLASLQERIEKFQGDNSKAEIIPILKEQRADLEKKPLDLVNFDSAYGYQPTTGLVGYSKKVRLLENTSDGKSIIQVSEIALLMEGLDTGKFPSGKFLNVDQAILIGPLSPEQAVLGAKRIVYMAALVDLDSVLKTASVKRNIPYAEPANEWQMLDVYAPENAKNLPVVFWIHGGGWQAGDKTSVQIKPQAFMDKGFVFVSTNYRLLPNVDMGTIVRDVAKSMHWVHDHIAEFGGDPKRLLVMGHSAGAQLAALICTDDRYLKAEGLSLADIKGCVPVDGDTYDVPAIIETAETRRRAHGQPPAKFGHREKFGDDPAKHRDFSAVNHVAKDKSIPPFLILYVAGHPDNTAQAERLASVLTKAGIAAKAYGAQDTHHTKINDNLGLPDDPSTKAMFEFAGDALKK